MGQEIGRDELRRVAVVGTVVLDVVRSVHGSVHQALGGIAHSVAALSALADDGVEVVPVCRVGRDLEEHLVDAWRPLPNVSCRGCLRDPRPAPRSHLVYGETGAQADRTERLDGSVEPLEAADLEIVRGADLTLVNAITGRDLTTAAMESLAGSRVYLDFHGRAFRPDRHGERRLGRPADWRRWVDAAGFLQCNEVEAAILAGLEPDAAVRPGAGTGQEVEGLVADLLTGPGRTRAVVVTRGERGAVAFSRGRDGRAPGAGPVERHDVEAPPVEPVDPTGAGDAFGAACALAWARGRSTRAAVGDGVRAGSAACKIKGPPSPEVLRRALAES